MARLDLSGGGTVERARAREGVAIGDGSSPRSRVARAFDALGTGARAVWPRAWARVSGLGECAADRRGRRAREGARAAWACG